MNCKMCGHSEESHISAPDGTVCIVGECDCYCYIEPIRI